MLSACMGLPGKAEEIHDVGHLGFDENEAGYGSSDKMIDN